jgi:hypothetical protein
VAQRVTTGAVSLPVAWEQELIRLATSDDARWILRLPHADGPELAAAAVEAANRWRVYAVAGAGPAQSRVAQVAHRGFHLLAQAIRSQASQPQPPDQTQVVPGGPGRSQADQGDETEVMSGRDQAGPAQGGTGWSR